MSTIVVVSIPLASHYIPVVKLAEELQQRGHHVTYISSAWSMKAVEANHPTLQTFGIKDNLQRLLLGSEANLFKADKEFNTIWKQPLREELLRIRPSLLICDMTTTVAVDLSKELNIPLGCNLPGGVKSLDLLGVPSWRGSLTIGGCTLVPPKIKALLIGLALPTLAHSMKHAVTGLVLLNSFLGLDEATALPPNFFYTGSLAKPSKLQSALPEDLQHWLDSTGSKPTVYVTFGSMVDLSQEFIAAIYNGLKLSGLAVLWSLKRGVLPQINHDFYVRQWLPQPQLLSLPQVKAVITHCGWNGVLDCIEARKPMLMVPEFNDQPGNCQRLLELNTGVRLYKKWPTLFLWRSLEIREVRFTPEHLARCLKEVIDNPEYRQAVEKLHHLSRQSLGVKGSCDLIQQVMEYGYGHLQDRRHQTIMQARQSSIIRSVVVVALLCLLVWWIGL